MTSPINDHGEGIPDRLSDIVEELIRLHESGELVDLDEFCARHPESVREEVRNKCEQVLRVRGVIHQGDRLTSGHNLASYEIIELIGKGGMGEVYRARDRKLGREIAIKVLPPDLACQPERVKRFEREYKAIAALDHPNIVTIHSVESSGQVPFLTMQLIEGETLSERIPKRGFSLDKFFDLAIPMADAISKAHEHGIVHRDLKPTNVMVTGDGRVKILDFGLAKLREEVSPEGSRAQARPLTEEGMIVGTAAYLSPEQAEGKDVDHRSDIFALGILLYEMATGEQPFKGDTKVALVSSIVKDTPRPITELKPGLPRHLGRIVRRCLSKDVAQRYQTAVDVGNELTELKREIDSGEMEAPPLRDPRRSWLRPVLALGFAGAVVAAFLIGRVSHASEFNETTWPVNLSVPIEFVGEATGGVGNTAMALAPDFSYFTWVGSSEDGTTTQLYLRNLQTLEEEPLADTEGAHSPFFSPDSQWLGFFADQVLWRVSIAERTVDSIAETLQSFGGTWGEGGRIAVLTHDGRKLGTVEPSGSELDFLDVEKDSSLRFAQPFWLPDSEWILLTCSSPWHIAAVNIRTRELRHLPTAGRATVDDADVLRGSNPRYLEPGYLIYSGSHENRVYGVRFDAVKLEVIGTPEILLDNVRQENIHASLQLAIADNGNAVYAPGHHASVGKFVAVPVDGRDPEPLGFEVREYGDFRYSPTTRQIAAKVLTNIGQGELRFLPIDRPDGDTPWIDEGLLQNRRISMKAWVPGTSDILVSVTGSPVTVYQVDGTQPIGGTQAWQGAGYFSPRDVGREGHVVISARNPETGASNVAILEPGGLASLLDDRGATLEFLYRSEFNQGSAVLSPDMRWLAYTRDENGFEVWVLPLTPEAKPAQAEFRISDGPGETPVWTSRSDGLYYRYKQWIFWVALTPDGTDFENPERVTRGNFLQVAGTDLQVDSGKTQKEDRLLLLEGTGPTTSSELILLYGWRAVLERKLGR